MYEAFVTAFIVHFIVIDHVGNMPIFLAVTQHQNRVSKLRTALDGKIVATVIMVFFALCRRWVLAYLKITEAAFRNGAGIIPYLWRSKCLALRVNNTNLSSSSLATIRTSRTEPTSSRLSPTSSRPIGIMSVIDVTAGLLGTACAAF